MGASGAGLPFSVNAHHYSTQNRVEARLAKKPALKRIDRTVGEHGARLIFPLRLSPLIPFNVSNYIYGLTSVRFWPYVLASWIGMLPGTLLYVYLSAAGRVGLGSAAGQTPARSYWEYVLFELGLIATIVVTVWIARIGRKELSKVELNNGEA
jgi:uncharacterized membrane protein YdjX (TVP38/TMEM64 family)